MVRPSRLEMEGKLDRYKGEIRRRWGQLTDDDFARAEGNYDRLVGIIKERTGRTTKDIETELDRLFKK